MAKYLENSRSRNPDAVVALDNSSSLLLTSGSTFTGSTDDVFAYSSIAVNVFASHPGTLYIKQSMNGTNFDHVKTFPIGANRGETHAVVVSCRYCQISYTNGDTDQTTFRLQTIYHLYKSIETSKTALNSILDEDSDSQLVRVSNDPTFDLVTGRLLKRKQVKVYGYTNELRVNITQMIRDEGTADTDAVFLAAPSVIRVKAGGSVNDAAAGTGVRSVLVKGLDGNYNPIEEVIPTAGASAGADSTLTFLRVFSAKADTVGTLTVASGNINIESSAGVQLARISAGNSISARATYTVPAGYSAYVKSVKASCPADKLGWFDLMVKEYGADKPKIDYLRWQAQGTSNSEENIDYSIKVDEKSDIWISGISEGGTIKDVNAELTLLLINESLA